MKLLPQARSVCVPSLPEEPAVSVLPSLIDPRLPRNTKPLKTCADIHGQYAVLRLLYHCGAFPPRTRYLFLGCYVDRGQGEQTLETICLLQAYKVKCAETFLLRGNPSSTPPLVALRLPPRVQALLQHQAVEDLRRLLAQVGHCRRQDLLLPREAVP
ncbi:hypothetical protein HPB48_022547 [Haemaphysalis longicornis]|uniref:protein-serine/threonine phosphatase n=1 Tax=Haemaphysalis longicornis TaxID=44386 RepID=A0A9J6FT04_HAELO|nr:hypothetical protein HPB48_022547 [Haemaphysalis longicornis]